MATAAADPATLSLDEITGQLVPRDNGKNAAEIRVIRLLLALPMPKVTLPPCQPGRRRQQ